MTVDWNLIRCGPNQLCIPDGGLMVWVREGNGNIDIGFRETNLWCHHEWTIVDNSWRPAIGVTHWAHIRRPEPPEEGRYDTRAG